MDKESLFYTIYPNPVGSNNAVVYINNEKRAPLSIFLYDDKGKLLYSTNVCKINDCKIEVGFDPYKNGIYFLRIQKNKEVLSTNKVIKTD